MAEQDAVREMQATLIQDKMEEDEKLSQAEGGLQTSTLIMVMSKVSNSMPANHADEGSVTIDCAQTTR